MKRGALQTSKRIFGALAIFIGLFASIPIQEAVAANDVQTPCVIGSSSSCPAQSPQEIYNLYGTTANGSYWLNVNGTATQTYLVLDTSYPDGGMWFLGMKGSRGSTTFTYSTTYWTSQSTTTGTTSLSNDVSTDAKFDAFNYLPVTKLVAVFKDRASNAFNAGGSGDLGTNSFAGHTWMETVTSTTMFSRFTTASNLVDGSGYTGRYTIHRETNSSSGKLVFPYQTGWTRYGFNNSTGYNYRWGVTSNNEGSMGSNDTGSGIGMDAYSAAAIVSYSDNLTVGPDGSSGSTSPGTSSVPSGFQIWGKMAAPSMAAPTSLSRTIIGNSSVTLNIGAASGATEYAVQYKLSADTWANSTTVRVTSPNASPTAALTGLTSGTYDFRVWTRGTNDSSASSVSLLSQTIDSTAPTVSQTTFSTSPSSGWYGLGETATVQITYSETVTVTGSPRLPITGLSGKYFTYASGSGSKVLLFSYVVAVGDLLSAGAGVASTSLALNGGTIKDLALNDASLDNQALIQSGLHKFDGVVPTVSSVVVSANGNSVVITLSETSSSVALTGTPFNLTVNSVRDVVTLVNQSGTKATLTLTFGIVAGDNVSLTYTDPNSTNDIYALQDLAGNDIPTFTTVVTNNSVATSNTSISLAVTPDTTTAVYRLNNSIIATVSTAGKVDFKLQGKFLAGCRNVSTTGSGPITATCNWKPSIHNSVTITAILKPTGAGFMTSYASPLPVFVMKRTTTR